MKKKHAFNPSRARLLEENSRFAAAVPEGALVLDAGAGEAPYAKLFSHARYETADFLKVDKPYENPTYVCDLSSIPVEDGRFDFVLFNQVMEHLPEPDEVLRELFRVLKPEGRVLYSGPLFYEEHEIPYDFYRYTQFGVRHLFDKAGFRVERLDWLEGYYATLGHQLAMAARVLKRRPGAYGGGIAGVLAAALAVLLRPAFVGLALIFQRLEMRHKYVRGGLPKNYIAVFVKPRSD
jgi:SAM-dependent methyltransferase